MKNTEESSSSSSSAKLLKKYRSDRQKLLEFILSSTQTNQIEPIPDSINSFDSISVNHVLNCINSGQVLNLSEASDKYREESIFPVTIESSSGSGYFLCSNPELSGSPPRRAPPTFGVETAANSVFFSSNEMVGPPVTEDIANSRDVGHTDEADGLSPPVDDGNLLSFGLPDLSTGISEDDLQETAYELLLSSMAFSGVQLYSFENKEKENKPRFLSRLKSKRERIHVQPQKTESHLDLLNIIRSQMQISEAIDARIRQRLMQFASTKSCTQIDIADISLELLNGIGRYDFPSEKLYIKWKSRQACILEELLYYSPDLMADELSEIKSSIEMLRNDEKWDASISTSEQSKFLLAIKKFSLKLSSMPRKFGIPGETYYWTRAYHLNTILYEKLLSSVFDILDEGQLIKEVDEILLVIKMTWATLGINQKIHHALYGWVLFRKYVESGEIKLLNNAIIAIQKLQSTYDDEKQEAYMNSLVCSRAIKGTAVNLNLLESISLSISIWCDNKLSDHHQHFGQKAIDFERVLDMFLLLGLLPANENGDIKIIKFEARTEVASRHLKAHIVNSIHATCGRLSHAMSTGSIKTKSERKYPLAKLAGELILIAEKESTIFSPVLRRWCPEAGMISSMQLHRFYGTKLKPILEGVTCLSDEVRSVFPAAYMLDQRLTQLYFSGGDESKLHSSVNEDLEHYKIGEVCKPIILDWTIGQHAHILEWIDRAFELEDWGSLSARQRHAASIVEVFRILEETVDQLINLKLPLDVTHLQSVILVIFMSLDIYLQKMASQLVEKHHLYPAAPALTRFKETVIPTINKKAINSAVLEEIVLNKLESLTLPKLCVRVNTLQYIQNKLGTLEDSIRESWKDLATPSVNESINTIFFKFKKLREDAGNTINTISDLIGTRAVFWDLRDSFLFTLYQGNVEGARLENCLSHFDSVLDHVCNIIVDPVRDVVVQSICRSAMDGFVWVLLEGGPSRAFLDTDFEDLQEDLQILKDFFIVDGEGLPPAIVEKEAMLAQSIIYLYSLQSESLIEMLMMASEKVSTTIDYRDNPSGSCMEDAHTLLRVLCHKKDREASEFLRRHYQLPMSCEYEETMGSSSLSSSSPFVSDLLKSEWAKKSQKSFRSMTKRFQEVTYRN